MSLGALLADAQERGNIVRNAVRDLRHLRGKRKGGRRQDGRLKVGVDIPTSAEVRASLGKAKGWLRPLLMTAVFTGLRASELRGLLWRDVDLRRSELHVRQRVDKYNTIGRPKSEAGERTVPMPPGLVQALREWKLVCPKKKEPDDPVGQLWLVFPNGKGNVEAHANIVTRQLIPTMERQASTPVLDKHA